MCKDLDKKSSWDEMRCDISDHFQWPLELCPDQHQTICGLRAAAAGWLGVKLAGTELTRELMGVIRGEWLHIMWSPDTETLASRQGREEIIFYRSGQREMIWMSNIWDRIQSKRMDLEQCSVPASVLVPPACHYVTSDHWCRPGVCLLSP